MNPANYDPHPYIPVSEGEAACVEGWANVAERLKRAVASRRQRKVVVIVECYVGADEGAIFSALRGRLLPALALQASGALLLPDEVESLVAPYLGQGDPVFGRITDLTLPQFFDPGKIAILRGQVDALAGGVALVVGCGARLVVDGDILVYADLARWEAQQRQRRNEAPNLGAINFDAPPALKYKRAYFVDWRVCDRWKAPLIDRWDFVLDTNRPLEPKLAEGEAVRCGLREATLRPFRVVPFFDAAPWGGQWMKRTFKLDPHASNYGWGFDCVPEENSLVLGFGSQRFELPAMDLVLHKPKELLGEAVYAAFGAEFPIRFDLLDTVEGGNLSFQVHPLREYIQNAFGMAYTQDESYYLLDASPGASVFLGLREGVDPGAMIGALRDAQSGGAPFAAGHFATRWLANKHDHFLIPAGTVHCSGANCVVLEISATPYIFTFKLWDWGRLGLNGAPRPIHLERGAANIQWDRTTEWTRTHLINRFEPIAEGPGWRCERTGLHEPHFIETHRHWFTEAVPHDTAGGVNVLNLVEGREAIVESPTRAFAPFTVHYAETFIVPAAVGHYTVRPVGESAGAECATLKAFVRAATNALCQTLPKNSNPDPLK